MNNPVDVLTVKKSKGETPDDIEIMLKKIGFGDKMSWYKIIDYTKANNPDKNNDLFIFFVGLLAIMYTVIFLIKYLRMFIKKIKIQSDFYYISGVFRNEYKRIVLCFIVISVCVLAIIYIIGRIDYKFYVPDRYVPDDNIFDFKFYFDQFISGVKEKNMTSGGIYSILEYTNNNVLSFNLICNIFIFIFRVISVSIFKIMILGEVKFKKISLSLVILFITGGLAGAALSFVLGLKFAMLAISRCVSVPM